MPTHAANAETTQLAPGRHDRVLPEPFICCVPSVYDDYRARIIRQL